MQLIAGSFGQTMGSFSGFGLSSNRPNPFTSTGSAFSVSSSPAFGASGGFSFSTSGSTGPGAPNSFSFGTSSTPAFGASSSAAFVFGSAPASSSSFSFGAQAGQQGGNKHESYKWTPHDGESNAKMESISAIPPFKSSSHQELRLANCWCSDKGYFFSFILLSLHNLLLQYSTSVYKFVEYSTGGFSFSTFEFGFVSSLP
jgi:nuclear pore complex protein Nup98-Nup96